MELVVLGVGVNVNTAEFPPDLASIATSLRLARGGAPLDREAVLTALLDSLGRWIDRFVADGATPIAAAWRERSGMLGRPVTVNGIAGTAVDVDDEGALWVDAGDRKLRVLSGEVT
jgi:BirA family biotin operon repressor/biotin-[acetyl-CoA-carboxylase] ligase